MSIRMRLKRKANRILNGDIDSPDVEVATFSDALTAQTRAELIATHNAGADMLKAYEIGRFDRSIASAVRLLEELDGIYREWSQEMFAIQRRRE